MEIWKDITGYEGQYQVSNLGRVQGCDRFVTVRYKNGRVQDRFVPSRILAANYDSDGYVQVSLPKPGGGQISLKVHQLVMSAFSRHPRKGREVDHRNGLRSDNAYSNLRWATVAQNRFNLHAPVKGSSQVRCVRHRPDKLNPWQAYARENGRFKSLGHYGTKDEAAKTRQAYEENRKAAHVE